MSHSLLPNKKVIIARLLGKLTVFNIGGNKYRLIAAIHFNRQKVYVRNVLTHKEYDQGDWKE